MVLEIDFPYLIGDIFQVAVDYIAAALPHQSIQARNARAPFRLKPPGR